MVRLPPLRRVVYGFKEFKGSRVEGLKVQVLGFKGLGLGFRGSMRANNVDPVRVAHRAARLLRGPEGAHFLAE